MTPEPITQHNRQLLTRVAKETRTFSRYPAVSEQVECLPLETGELFKGGYNPALNAKGWLAYRYHVSKLGTRLAVAQLGENGSVISNREIAIEGKSVDDPKLFTHAGQDFISWVEANWDDADYQRTIRCVVKYGKFDGERVWDVVQPEFPGNDGTTLQKNYVLWGSSNRLFCIYQCHPTHRVYEISAKTGTPMETFETAAPIWPYGPIRGDTAPIPYEGKLLRFFHSRLDNEISGLGFRYYIGACLMNPEPPFEVVRVSKKPLIYGAEIGTVKKKDCAHWKPNVVFGGGAVDKDGAFILALGINDSECALCRIKPEQLNF